MLTNFFCELCQFDINIGLKTTYLKYACIVMRQGKWVGSVMGSRRQNIDYHSQLFSECQITMHIC